MSKFFVGAGSRNYRKRCYIGTRKSKKTVPERPRRESSTTAFKAAVNTGGLSYPHKGKGATGRGIEDEGKKRSDRGSGAHTHDQCWEAWKTAGSCGEGKRCIVAMVSVGKHGRLQRAVV